MYESAALPVDETVAFVYRRVVAAVAATPLTVPAETNAPKRTVLPAVKPVPTVAEIVTVVVPVRTGATRSLPANVPVCAAASAGLGRRG